MLGSLHRPPYFTDARLASNWNPKVIPQIVQFVMNTASTFFSSYGGWRALEGFKIKCLRAVLQINTMAEVLHTVEVLFCKQCSLHVTVKFHKLLCEWVQFLLHYNSFVGAKAP